MFRMNMREFRKLAAKRKRRGRLLPQVREVVNGPNHTEQRFNLAILCNRGRFHPEPFTVSKTAGRRYTADYACSFDGVPVVIEVKGSYKLPSENRARLAWELAAEQNPGTVFVWARNVDRSMWDCEAWYAGGAVTYRSVCYSMSDFSALLRQVLKERTTEAKANGENENVS